MFQTPWPWPAVLRRLALLLAMALVASLAACGGGGGDAPTPAAPPPTSTISGTAAAGAALAGVTVTVKDSTGKTGTATTGSGGGFTADTSGMNGPFLLQVSLPSGTVLYSVTADTQTATVANITPFTDLIVRSWYGVQGVVPASAFAAPASAPPPTPLQVRNVAQSLAQVLQLVLGNSGAGITDPLQLISQPFTADHTGIDKVFDNTHVTLAAAAITLVVTDGATTQTTVLSYDTAARSIGATTTTVNGGNTTTSSTSSVVPVTSADTQALQELQAVIDAFAGVVNSRGNQLTVTDVVSFMDPDLLDQGRNRDQFATSVSTSFGSGQTISFTILRVDSLDSAAGMAQLRLRVTENLGSQSATETVTLAFRKSGGSWLIYGDRRIANISLYAEGRRQGGDASADGPAINIDVQPVQGMATGVAVAGPSANAALVKQSTTVVDDSGALLDHYFYNTGLLTGTLPTAGSIYTLTLDLAAGGSVSYAVPLNAFTTELIQLTSPAGTTLADAHLGGDLQLVWTLPITYAVERVKASAIVETQHFQCEIQPAGVVTASTTTATLAMPATCNGEPITVVNLNVSADGVNGERSFVGALMRD